MRSSSLGGMLAALFAVGLFGPLATAQSVAPGFTASEERPEDFPEGAGRDEAFYACVACHNFKLVAAQGMSRAKWDETLTWMTTRHNMPELSGKDRTVVLDYLEKNYPAKPAAGGWKNPFSPR
jgi:mono/diheme cytochrome c family protein